jgi:hypothetical protein
VSPVKYELGSYITEDDILHSHRRENLKSHINRTKNHERNRGIRYEPATIASPHKHGWAHNSIPWRNTATVVLTEEERHRM